MGPQGHPESITVGRVQCAGWPGSNPSRVSEYGKGRLLKRSRHRSGGHRHGRRSAARSGVLTGFPAEENEESHGSPRSVKRAGVGLRTVAGRPQLCAQHSTVYRAACHPQSHLMFPVPCKLPSSSNGVLTPHLMDEEMQAWGDLGRPTVPLAGTECPRLAQCSLPILGLQPWDSGRHPPGTRGSP